MLTSYAEWMKSVQKYIIIMRLCVNYWYDERIPYVQLKLQVCRCCWIKVRAHSWVREELWWTPQNHFWPRPLSWMREGLWWTSQNHACLEENLLPLGSTPCLLTSKIQEWADTKVILCMLEIPLIRNEIVSQPKIVN